MSNNYSFLLLVCLGLVGTTVQAQTNVGSMIDPDAYQGLAADRRAHQLGDTLTVLVTEAARASAGAGTAAGSGVTLGAYTQGRHSTHNYGAGLSGSDTGQGNTSRVGMLQAQLAVRVVEVESDGMLKIRGEQTIVVNGEKQQFALNGLVRSEDIAADNTIASNRISDANIEFTGKGDVSEAQRRSIVYRVARWLHLI